MTVPVGQCFVSGFFWIQSVYQTVRNIGSRCSYSLQFIPFPASSREAKPRHAAGLAWRIPIASPLPLTYY